MALKTYQDYLFALDKGGRVSVYKDNRFLYAIDLAPLSTEDYDKLEDKRFNHLFDLVVHDGLIYISNDLETVYIYALNDQKPELISGISRIRQHKESGTYYVRDIPALLVYQDRFLLFSTEYEGLSCYDTQQGPMVFENKTLYPKTSFYSKLLKEEIDSTQSTSIYKMTLYNGNLIFSEVNDHISVYDLGKGRIVHRFDGCTDDVFALEVYRDTLISLASDGMLYIWDLKVLD